MLKVYIDGKRYPENFVKIKKSYLSMTNFFLARYTLNKNVPFIIGSSIEIKIENSNVFKGKIDKVFIKNGKVEISGGGLYSSILNSYPSKPINLNSNLTLAEVVNQCIDVDPIVENETSAFSKEELIIGNNETFSQFFARLASKRAVFIIENENGELVITRNNETDILGSFASGDNIIESSFCFNSDEIYQNIILYAQTNLNSFMQDMTSVSIDKIEGIKASSSDPLIEDERYLYIPLNYGISESNLQNLANFQVGLQRAKALKYHIKYPFLSLKNGQICDIGKLVKTNDSFNNIKGTFFIEELTLVSGTENEEKNEESSFLTLTYANAYKLNFEIGDNTNFGGFISV